MKYNNNKKNYAKAIVNGKSYKVANGKKYTAKITKKSKGEG